ncbi:unnamed protein product [Allacma fusca]|uniref:Dynein regulatory complex protein 10 n=1 Tax=Allacma fusca TaxID=39272 RepID=A0A8J2NZV6_9HEXA|nr:unnamed protein product [Allacma fusca]
MGMVGIVEIFSVLLPLFLVHAFTKQAQAWRYTRIYCQAWNESKSGRIPRSWSPTILLMEKRLSDKSDLNSTRLIVNAGTEDGRRQLQTDNTNNVTTFGSKIHVPNLTGSTVTVCPRRTETDKRHPVLTRQEKGNKLLNSEIKRKKQRVISLLEKDPSKLTFLWDLFAWGRDAREYEDKPELASSLSCMTREKVDALLHHKKIKTCQDEKRRNTKTNKVNILGLIRAALNSKYGDHVKNALKARDLKSLFCILSLLSGPDIPLTSFVWNEPTNTDKPRHRSMDAIKAMALTHHAPEKNKHHKIGCRRYVKPHTDEYKTVPLNQPDDRISHPPCNTFTQKHSQLPSSSQDQDECNLAFLFREDHSSDQAEDSLDSDTNLQSEIWGILNKDQKDDKHSDPQFFQEDTLDFDSNLILDATDDIETGIYLDSRLNDNEAPQLPATTAYTKIVKIPYLSSSSFADTDITSSDEFSCSRDGHLSPERMQVQPIRIPTPLYDSNETQPDFGNEPVISIKGRLSTQLEVTEDSRSRLESTRLDLEEADNEKGIPQMEHGEAKCKNAPLEEFSSSQLRLKLELRKSYKNVINLLVENFPYQWIEKEWKKPGHRANGATNGFKMFQKIFEALAELIYFRLATSVEEDLLIKRDLQERWKNERRNLLELRKLQTELKQLENTHIPRMLTLDFQIRILNSRLRKISKEMFQDIRQVLRDTELNAAIQIKEEEVRSERVSSFVNATVDDVSLLEKQILAKDDKLRQMKGEFNEALRKEIVRYDEAIFKQQKRLDDIIGETHECKRRVIKIKEKYDDVESRYIDMLAEKKLKQILRSIEMADDFKRNRAAKMIQECWRRYKIRKRKRDRKKARKGAKKKGGVPSSAVKKKSEANSVRDSESPPSRADGKSKPASAKSGLSKSK